MRKLKHDIWDYVDEQLPNPDDLAYVNAHSNSHIDEHTNKSKFSRSMSSEVANAMSFQTLVADLGEEQSQKEATLPFYFICLLHLANEKTLKIENFGGDMSDLFISKDV